MYGAHSCRHRVCYILSVPLAKITQFCLQEKISLYNLISAELILAGLPKRTKDTLFNPVSDFSHMGIEIILSVSAISLCHFHVSYSLIKIRYIFEIASPVAIPYINKFFCMLYVNDRHTQQHIVHTSAGVLKKRINDEISK